jgi:hypothetical protein
MACLGSVLYDPGTAATKATSSLLAMTALDTTNARITFTAPANGIVLVRIRVAGKGAVSCPMVLLGVLDGSTVKGRQACASMVRGIGSAGLVQREAAFLVTGLTPTSSYTWDAAYGIEFAVASTQLGWGGPNDTSASNAYGALSYEIWETANLLAGTMYDPSTAASAATTAASAVAALDTTNLRLAFTTNASGAGSTSVLVRLRSMINGAAAQAQVLLGVLDGSTIMGRCAPQGAFTDSGTLLATDHQVIESLFVVSGLAASTAYTWDAAYGTETVQASSAIRWGGPDDTTQDNAYGGFDFSIWAA